MKGLWVGFYKGIYNNGKPLGENCFGDESKQEIYDVFYFLGYGDYSDIFKAADSVAKLYIDNFEYCNFY